MKAIKFWRYRISAMLPYLAASAVIWLMCVLSVRDSQARAFYDLFSDAMGGTAHNGELDLFGVLRFFGSFFAGIFLGMAGTVSVSEKSPYFTFPREKSFSSWWRKTVFSVLLWCIIYSALGLIVCATFGVAEKLSLYELLSLATYPSALCAAMCIMCLLRFLIGQKQAAATVTAVLAVSGLVGGKLKHFNIFMLGVYGMAKQLTAFEELVTVLLIDWLAVLVVLFGSRIVGDRLKKGGRYFD